MVRAETIELHRAGNFRLNLRRIFDAWGVQTKIAADAGLHPVHLAQILNGKNPNPTIETIERLSVALEIPVEILLGNSPSDLDLRIFSEKSAQPS